MLAVLLAVTSASLAVAGGGFHHQGVLGAPSDAGWWSTCGWRWPPLPSSVAAGPSRVDQLPLGRPTAPALIAY
jgi:hypothetical protein